MMLYKSVMDTKAYQTSAIHQDTIEPLLSMRDICDVVGCSMRTLGAWRASGFLPDPDLEHGKTLRWRRQTIEDWIQPTTPR